MSEVLDRTKLFLTAAIVTILLIPVSVVLANSVPTSELWLEFDYQTADQPDLEGVQIIGCEATQCHEPTLVDQYGRCDEGPCLDATPSRVAQRLECVNGTCLMVFTVLDHNLFKVVGQFSDRVRESDVRLVNLNLSYDYGDAPDSVWQIAVEDTALSVAVSEHQRRDTPINRFFNSFHVAFLFTIVVEVLVAALALRGWLKIGGRTLWKGLVSVLLANVISYPATWIFWLSLAQFRDPLERAAGYFFVVVAAWATILIARLSWEGRPTRRRRVIDVLTLLLLPAIACWLGFLGSFRGSLFGRGLIAVSGLPAGLTIALAEVSAVAFEALLLYLLARRHRSLSWKQASVISLAMNATSFVLSLVVFF